MGISGFKRPKAPGGAGAGGGTEFIYHVNEGDKLICALKGDPVFVLEHFDQKTKKRIACTGDENCPACADGDTPKQAFLLNCFVAENDKIVGKILKLGGVHYDTFIKFEEDFGDILTQAVKVTRTGNKSSTRYYVVPAKNPPQILVDVATGKTPAALKDMSKFRMNISVEEPTTPDGFDN